MRLVLIFSLALLMGCGNASLPSNNPPSDYTGKEFSELNQSLAKGWNTWNTKSVLSHVLLPECMAINLQLKNNRTGDTLKEALIGRRSSNGEPVEKIIPGDHAYDGSYTSLELEWQGIKTLIESAVVDDELVLLIQPLQKNTTALLIVQPAMLWQKKGQITEGSDGFTISSGTRSVNVYTTRSDKKITTKSSALTAAFLMDEKTGISTGSKKNIEQIEIIIAAAKAKMAQQKEKYKAVPDLYSAMQRVLAWDVIYEPVHDRVIAPVSRIWSAGMWGGWVLFDWDTYFSSLMLSMDNKALAYSNAIAITHEISPGGFIPNFAAGISKSNDRSQPPVGSLVIKENYIKNIRRSGCCMKCLTTCLLESLVG